MLPPQSGEASLSSTLPAGNGNGNGHGNGEAAGFYGPGALIPIGPMFPGPNSLTTWPGAAAPQRPTFLTSGPDPRTLWHALRRRWPLAIGCGLAAGLVATALSWFFIPANYEVQALFEVRRAYQTDPTGTRTASSVDRDEHEMYKKSQQQLVKSHLVLTDALRAPGIAQLPSLRSHQSDMLTFLDDEILVDYPGGADILRVRMRGEDADELVKVVEAVTDAYRKNVIDKERERKQTNRQFLTDQYNLKKRDWDRLNAEYVKYTEDLLAQDTGSVDIRVQMLLSEVQSLRKNQWDLEMQQIAALQQVEMINGQIEKAQSNEVSSWAIMQALRIHPDYLALSDQVKAINEQIRMTQSVVTDKNGARIQNLLTQKAEVEQQIDDLKQELIPTAHEMIMGQSMGGLQIDLKNAKATAETNTKQIEAVKAKIVEESARIAQLGGLNADFLNVKQERDLTQASLLELEEARRNIDLELDGEDTRVSLFMSPTKPDGNEWLFKYFLTGLFGCGALGLTMFGVTYREFQERRISNSTQVADGLGMRVVGALPSLRRANVGVIQTLLNESIDRVRTLLLHAASNDGTKVVMVTSAVDQEGKTTVASQLAASLARCGRRTLLIDGDIRNPGLHELFDLPVEPGLCEALRGEIELDDAIRPSRLPGLWVLPAGRCDLASVQALAKDGVAAVFESVRPEFDFIILDSAPVLTVADSLSLGQHVDAAILSVLRDVSQGAKVFEASERLRGVGVNVMGAVVNGEAQKMHRRLVDLQAA